MPTASRPRIAVTLGDPAGIGPEVARKALADKRVRDLADFVIFGPPAAAWARLAGAKPSFVRAACGEQAWDGSVAAVTLVECGGNLGGILPRAPSAEGGEAAVRYVLAAIEAARLGRVDAIVTGPISKEAVGMAGYPWPGHTELLAEKFGADDVAMMFAGGPFRVVLVTIHVPLAEAIRSITAARIVRVCRLGSDAVRRWFGVSVPRVGVCGLNPHAGEAGRFGHEERQVIGPAIEEARAAGLCAFGPLPPDTAFRQAMLGRFDLIVAMYHDQGLIPIKTVAFEESVNITLGLPIVRTSVDHGTAFDIAGRGRADPHSMKAAVRMAVAMVARGRGAARAT